MKRLALPVAVLAVLFSTDYSQSVTTTADVVLLAPITGNDNGGNCGQGAFGPCKTFAAALANANDPGTIAIIESGQFAPITITTGLSITCPGVTCLFDGSAAANGGTAQTAITVNGATKTVSLHNVTMSGFGTGVTGLSVTAVDKLDVSDCGISGNGIGISFTPGTGANSHLVLRGSTVRFSTSQNVLIAPTGSTSATVVLRDTKIHHGMAGIKADASVGTGGISMVVVDSQIMFHNNNGINAYTNVSGGPSVTVLLDRVDVSHSSGNGVSANGSAAVLALSKSMVTQTAEALTPVNGGQIFTYGDNDINFNASNGPAPTTAGGYR